MDYHYHCINNIIKYIPCQGSIYFPSSNRTPVRIAKIPVNCGGKPETNLSAPNEIKVHASKINARDTGSPPFYFLFTNIPNGILPVDASSSYQEHSSILLLAGL